MCINKKAAETFEVWLIPNNLLVFVVHMSLICGRVMINSLDNLGYFFVPFSDYLQQRYIILCVCGVYIYIYKIKIKIPAFYKHPIHSVPIYLFVFCT